MRMNLEEENEEIIKCRTDCYEITEFACFYMANRDSTIMHYNERVRKGHLDSVKDIFSGDQI